VFFVAVHVPVVLDSPDLSDVLHDLGQPLAAIQALASIPPPSGSAGNRAADLPAGEPPDELYQRLRRIGQLVDWMNVLLYSGSRVAADEPATADAVRVIEDVLLAAAVCFDGALRWRPSGSNWVALEPSELRRAIGNVVDNATRAAGPGGWVRVGVRQSRHVRIDVEDSGPGFGKVSAHTGRGLLVTRAVLDRCGGGLDIARGRSGGALVRLTLPRAVHDPGA
jgi:signal transduction histidine kinase